MPIDENNPPSEVRQVKPSDLPPEERERLLRLGNTPSKRSQGWG